MADIFQKTEFSGEFADKQLFKRYSADSVKLSRRPELMKKQEESGGSEFEHCVRWLLFHFQSGRVSILGNDRRSFGSRSFLRSCSCSVNCLC